MPAISATMKTMNIAPNRVGSLAPRSRAAPKRLVATQAIATVKEKGSASVKGTVRKVNEDVYHIVEDAPFAHYTAVFDGHGGVATASWLKENFVPYVEDAWNPSNPKSSLLEACLAADREILSGSKGFFGMGERGIGGSKCGATAAIALIYEHNGKPVLATANVGDARILLIKEDGSVEPLFYEHVPDDDDERARIERYNPNKKMPLVRYVGGTWRVGGLLALSRAFGDAYMKSSLQFEGVPLGSDGYSSGFGVISEPFVTETILSSDCTHVVVASDGLFNEVQRGGGGGMTNEEVAQACKAQGSKSCTELAAELIEQAVSNGSTDDVTVCVLKLDRSKLSAAAARKEAPANAE